MQRLELYLFRVVLIAVLAALAVSPFVAVTHFLHGVVSRSLDGTHLFALGYLLLIAFCLFLISPIFSENKY